MYVALPHPCDDPWSTMRLDPDTLRARRRSRRWRPRRSEALALCFRERPLRRRGRWSSARASRRQSLLFVADGELAVTARASGAARAARARSAPGSSSARRRSSIPRRARRRSRAARAVDGLRDRRRRGRDPPARVARGGAGAARGAAIGGGARGGCAGSSSGSSGSSTRGWRAAVSGGSASSGPGDDRSGATSIVRAPSAPAGWPRVYEARHVDLHKRVALKVLHPWLALRLDVVQRFVLEARAASRLAHPHVVGISDIGSHRRRPLHGHGPARGRAARRGPRPRAARSRSSASPTCSCRCSPRWPRRTRRASSTAISSPTTSSSPAAPARRAPRCSSTSASPRSTTGGPGAAAHRRRRGAGDAALHVPRAGAPRAWRASTPAATSTRSAWCSTSARPASSPSTTSPPSRR